MKAILFFVLVVFSVYSSADYAPYYATIPIALQAGESLPLLDEIEYELESSDPRSLVEKLGQWQGIRAQTSGSNSVIIRQRTHPHFEGAVLESYMNPSFVIDFDEQDTFDFVSGFKADSDEVHTLEGLKAYIDRYIDDPTYIHGFNIASEVALNRSGDCTEYAVLTVALARAVGWPARVVLGVSILNSDDSLSAYGHAWAEIWHDEKWEIVDAALYPQTENAVFYLPFGGLDNEGLGYLMGLLSVMQAMPSSILAVRSVPP